MYTGDNAIRALTIEAVGDDEVVLQDVLVQKSAGKIGCHLHVIIILPA